MRAVIQRVSKASVTIDNKIYSQINNGLLVLLGIEDADTAEDIEWLSGKIVNLRIFNDVNGVMNVSIKDIDADILIVSQFTLHAPIILYDSSFKIMSPIIRVISIQFVINYSLFFVSITIVTGPSFSSSTFISAPNTPVPTVLPRSFESC